MNGDFGFIILFWKGCFVICDRKGVERLSFLGSYRVDVFIGIDDDMLRVMENGYGFFVLDLLWLL